MSRAWRGGSTRAWRQLRAQVLERDGGRCQVPDGDGVCGAPAITVGHLDPLRDGHPKLAPSSRLRAECTAHNYADGARATNSRRQRTWSW